MLQDIELLESGSILKGLRFPHKIKKVTQIVITAGQFSCLVDFRMWSLKAPAVALFLPGQVVETIELDEDFSGFGMVMNQEFTDSLNLPVSLQERLFIKGRSTRIWFDLILKKRLQRCIDWSKINKKDYLQAMQTSVVNVSPIFTLLSSAITDKINDRETFMKGIDYSYYYEQED